MPALINRGSMSANGFGFSIFTTGGGGCATDGTVGIFAIGCTAGKNPNVFSVVRNKYTYASCTSTACGVGSASLASAGGAAAGNSSRGIFALGFICNGAAATAVRNKYTYACCSSTASGTASASVASGYQSAAGNSTRGIFAIGAYFNPAPTSTATRNKYIYASDTSTACGIGAASAISFAGEAVGNSTRGIFALGEVGTIGGTAAPSTTRNKYIYACDTSTACGVAASSATSAIGSAAGNSTRGIFTLGLAGGAPSTTRNKYIYACDTSTASGVGTASAATYGGSATGNSTRGIFSLGGTGAAALTTRNKYTYACDTSTACGVAAASTTTSLGSAASWALCVNT